MATLRQYTARLCLALCVALTATGPVRSESPAPAAVATAAAGAEPIAAAVPLAVELAQARREQIRLSAGVRPGAPLLDERRNALNRLVMLLETRQPAATASASEVEVPPDLPGSGPWQVADVDNLRDQRDATAAQRMSLELSVHALDSEIENLLQVRRKADETLRLRQDQFAGARPGEDRVRLRALLDLSRMQARIAALEAARADELRSAARNRLQSLAASIDVLEREIARVRRDQRLDDPVISEIARSADAERRRIASQREVLGVRLVALESQRIVPGAPAAREIEALRATLAALGNHDLIERGRADVWRLRQSALKAGDDAERRTAAEVSLRRARGQMDAQLRAAKDQLEFARASVRLQRTRLQGLAIGDPTRPAEQRAFEASDLEVHARESLHDAIARLSVLLQRSLEDLELAQQPESLRDWLGHVGTAALGMARSAWEYELFSVSERTQVEGRTVTVDYGITVGKSIGVLLLFGLGYWLARRVTRHLVGWMVSRAQVSPQLARVLQRWLMSILLLVVVLMVLRMARIPLTAFAFMGGALAIGVGFGAQTVIRNVISGVIILFERKIRVGDIVTIGGMSGTVTAVDLRATTVRGFDGIESILPNSSLLEHQVSNWTYQNPTVRRTITVGIAYDSDVRQAADLIAGCARDHPATLDTPPPEVLFDDFGADAMVLKLQLWIRLGGDRPGPNIESDLRFAIEAALRAAGIAIPVPQREVRIVASRAARRHDAPVGSVG